VFCKLQRYGFTSFNVLFVEPSFSHCLPYSQLEIKYPIPSTEYMNFFRNQLKRYFAAGWRYSFKAITFAFEADVSY
jgi:capsid protein